MIGGEGNKRGGGGIKGLKKGERGGGIKGGGGIEGFFLIGGKQKRVVGEEKDSHWEKGLGRKGGGGIEGFFLIGKAKKGEGRNKRGEERLLRGGENKRGDPNIFDCGEGERGGGRQGKGGIKGGEGIGGEGGNKRSVEK